MNVLLRITNQCNQDCCFCNVSSDESVSLDEAMRRVRQAKDLRTLSISGGEPTLNKGLLELIREAKKNPGIQFVSLQTNAAAAASFDYAGALKEAGLDEAFVAFHSHQEKLSNVLTGSQLWQKTVSGIQNLTAAGIKVVINTVINKATYEQLPEFCVFVNRTFPDVKEICFSFIQPHGRAWKNRSALIPRYSEVVPFLKKALEVCDGHGISYCNPYCGFPLCLFPAPKKYSSEFLDSPRSSSEKEGVSLVKRDKAHGPACQHCAEKARCNGVWKKYAEIYGFSELKPFEK